MRMRIMVAGVALLAAALSTLVAGAHQIDPYKCAGAITAVGPGLGGAEAKPLYGTTGKWILYVADDAQGTWVYLESNKHAGLQRGGYNPTLEALVGRDTTETAGEKDPCDSTVANGKRHSRKLKPDTIVF